MNSKPNPKLHTFSLILGASGLLALLAGCPTPPDICALGFGPPTANAGADQNIQVGQGVTLNGNASTDPDGDALTYQWQQTSGPVNVNLINPNGAMATFVPQVKGVYVFALTVSDGCNSDEQTVQISVFIDPDGIGRPLASAGPDFTVNEGERSICLTGIRSADPNGRPLTFSWTQLSGPDVFLSNPFVAEVCFDAPDDVCGDQSLVLELTVVNDIQLRDKDEVAVTVHDLDGECCTSDADCDDLRLCTEDTCDTAAGSCVFTLIQCPEGQTCDEMTGDCVDIDPCRDVTCDDGDPCTTDKCVEGDCVSSALDCDDEDACTEDTCVDGACVNDPIDIDDDLFCTGTETCDPGTGEITSSGNPCEEGTFCNEDTDTCDTDDVCTTNADCDDGDMCTRDLCDGGVCSNPTIPDCVLCELSVITQIIGATGDRAGNLLDGAFRIAVDGSGDVYVAGKLSNNAFKITPGGEITQIIDATSDGAGHVLTAPLGIAVDGSGNVYVAAFDSDNAFKITPGGVITQIIDSTGDGVGNGLDEPIYIAVGASENVYVTGKTSDNAFKITPGGEITQIIDSTGDGAGNILDHPEAIAVDGAGNVYVTGHISDNAFKITPGGEITQIIDSTGDGAGNELDRPAAIAVDGSGNVYVTGRISDNAFKITPGRVITEIIDGTGDGTGNLCDAPVGVAVDGSRDVYVTCAFSDNAFKVTPGGLITQIIDASGDGAGNPLDQPVEINVDGVGNVYLTGARSNNAFKIQFDPDCDDGLFCNGPETCNIDTGTCEAGTAPCAAGETCDEDADECTPVDTEADTIRSSEWLTGAIDPVVDQDAYTFMGQAGDVVFIQVNRTSEGLNPQMRLFPPDNGPREALVGDSTFNNHSIAALFEHALAESGQYTILVLDDGLDSTGDYILSYLNLSQALTSLQDPDGGPIAFGGTRTGAIDPVTDQDVYTFTGQAGQVVFIQANRTSGGVNPQIRLFPPSGLPREALVGDSTFNNHSIAALFEHALAESGQYMILILDDGLDSTGEYILSLSALP